ncbi:DUF6505 family protein [Phreatobacter stygius]|uniref:Uncharacterized protein n=1 Tax=Phreatobacter stygius TaxID=1940610 RepID=A0A4D7BJL5_9HYPH|nr:DUF6505 family protein [Phreatobacter stygius]QCI67907.1 hypothetical protein E8M01_28955 [Phreatobacter stygius]
MKLLRTIRLDPSDTFVFPRAAEPGEWAVTGTFLFWGRDVAGFEGKERAAFRSGFLGVDSFGFSTLVVVQEARDDERSGAVEALASHIHRELGAPDLASARAAAEEEIAFSASLADHEPNTLVALHRLFEAGEIREAFRTLKAREGAVGADGLHAQARAFSFHEVVDDDAVADEVDLIGMMDKRA